MKINVGLQKRQQDVSDFKLSKTEVERRENQRQDETRRELEKVKKRKAVSSNCCHVCWRCCHVCVCVQEREKEREAREDESVSTRVIAYLTITLHPLHPLSNCSSE